MMTKRKYLKPNIEVVSIWGGHNDLLTGSVNGGDVKVDPLDPEKRDTGGDEEEEEEDYPAKSNPWNLWDVKGSSKPSF